MKKSSTWNKNIGWIVSGSVLILAFTLITVNRSGRNEQPDPAGPVDTLQHEELYEFWGAYRRATTLRTSGKWAEALENYRQALEINGDHSDALYYMGNMYLELGEYADAEMAFQRIIDLDQESMRGHLQLGYLYSNLDAGSLHDLKKARTEFTMSLAINKDFIQPQIRLGEISLLEGDLDQSRSYFETVLGADPGNPESNLYLGYIHWIRGSQVQALHYFNSSQEYKKEKEPVINASNEGDTESGAPFWRQMDHSLILTGTELPPGYMDQPEESMQIIYRAIAKFISDNFPSGI